MIPWILYGAPTITRWQRGLGGTDGSHRDGTFLKPAIGREMIVAKGRQQHGEEGEVDELVAATDQSCTRQIPNKSLPIKPPPPARRTRQDTTGQVTKL